MFRNLLFTMSLSGSIVVVFYVLFYPLTRRYFSLVWRYRILKTALFFYLIPVGGCKYYVFGILQTMFPNLWNKIYKLPEFNAAYSISAEGGVIRLSPDVYKIVFILLMSGMISCFIFFRAVIQNQRLGKLYTAGTDDFTSRETQEILSEVRKELGIKRRIRFVSSEYCLSPVTCGMISPVVWLPSFGDKKPNNKLFRYMVKHELLHIKRNDILVKYLSLFVVAVHWFNPFSYFLYHELSSIGEMYCDSGVLEGKGENERREYSELLLQAAVRKTSSARYSLFIGMADKGYQKIMKRRILEMKARRKNKTFFSVMVMIFICIIGGITAFAYEPPSIIGGTANDDFTFDREYVEENMNPIPWNQYFTDGTGAIYQIHKQDYTEHGMCNHKYIQGTLGVHSKTDHGCSITEYDAIRCSLCAYIFKKEETNVITYKKCPH